MNVYCSMSYQQGSCPKCSMSLAPVKYCSAIQGKTTLVAQNQKIDWEKWKKITTTTKSTQYSDIQPHTGSMCLNCCNKAENIRFLVPRILFGIGTLTLIIAIIYAMITDFDTNDMRFVVPGIIAVVLLFIGWKTMDNDSYYNRLMTSKKYYGSKELVNITANNSIAKGNMNVASSLLMKYISPKDIPQGRVLLSTGMVENIKKAAVKPPPSG